MIARRIWFDVNVCVAALALLVVVWFLFGRFAVVNFPFTSGVIAQAAGPSGEEACVIQTFKGAEPYQVSLYARRPDQPWIWHYLAHQDNRWRNCHIEFTNGVVRVYKGSSLRMTLSIAEATTPIGNHGDHLPASYTPEQILAKHNEHHGN